MKTALVLGAGGFIGSHMVKRLKKDGYWVRGVDLKYPDFSMTEADEFITRDLRDPDAMRRVIRYGGQTGNFYSQIVDKFLEPFDEIYQLLLIWVVLVTSLLVRMMQILCITQHQLI